MDKRLPGARFRIFLFVLGVCIVAGMAARYFEQDIQAGPRAESGTLEKLAVANGTVTLNVDTGRLTSKTASRMTNLRFDIQDSLFTVLVRNGELRGSLPGSMNLTAQTDASIGGKFGAASRHLAIESVPYGSPQFIVRDAQSGFAFFGIEGAELNYDDAGRSLTIADGRLVLTEQFAASLGRPADRGTRVGEITVTATMRPIEITQYEDGRATSDVMPPSADPNNGTNPGPDVVVGNLIDILQYGTSANGQVGIAIGTEACNFGTVDVDWFQTSLDHPVIPQNLYRMSGGTLSDQTIEQIGQSQMKHTFEALGGNICNLGCNGHGGNVLGSGCSDPYGSNYNSGPNLGSRAWVNPFTGSYSGTQVNNHNGHIHLGPSHRVLVNNIDLEPSQNPGAVYVAEGQYVTPHEYTWCSNNPGACLPGSGSNTFNDVSWRYASVSGTDGVYNFTWAGTTNRTQPALFAWPGATITRIEPDPGNDGAAYIAYKVTNPSTGVYHYEYAIYNMNLDRSIQSFMLPLGSSVTKLNVGFHAPPQHPGWTFDGTVGNLGYSSTPWALTETAASSTWSTDSFAQDPNANAVRWGTLYNIRFDSNREPSTMFATIGFYKTGNPVTVQVVGPSNPQAPWPCTSRRRNGVPLPNCG